MTTAELKVPSVGESITEVQIGDWLIGEGKGADKDQSLVVIETDKITTELPAPFAGTVTKIIKRKGEKAVVGEVIGYMTPGAATAATATATPTAAPASSSRASTAATAPPVASAAAPTTPTATQPATPTATPPAAPSRSEASVEISAETRVMPAAARALHAAGLVASDVTATGPGGRLLKEDVERAAAAPQAAPPAAARPAPAPAIASGERHEETVAMTPMRKRIAQRLVEAQNTAALLTTFNEIDMSVVMALRNEHKDAFQKKNGLKLGFMPFFVKGAIEALKLVPEVNAEIRGESIVYRNYYDIGVAVGSGKGLLVPVLRNAERLSFAGIEAAIADFGARAQAGKITLDDLAGGTFTISNGGIYGSLLSTPILNPPQSGILGMHAIQERPVALNGQVVIRPMMYVALTYDHRIVDGREAVTFLKRIKECVENPARMLLEI